MMSELEIWSKLFTKSSFFAIKKEEDLSPELKILQSKIIYSPNVETFHPQRKDEFLLGRICASKAYESIFKEELLSLPTNKDRSPMWPANVLGAITHDKDWVGAAVAQSQDLVGVGIDFEMLGRTKIELASQIRSPQDLKTHPDLSPEELLTLIFSCKESLYKALYPSVQKFFGFEDAAVLSIDISNGKFSIDLLSQISLNFGPNSRQSFEGRFTIVNKTCLTILEIFP